MPVSVLVPALLPMLVAVPVSAELSVWPEDELVVGCGTEDDWNIGWDDEGIWSSDDDEMLWVVEDGRRTFDDEEDIEDWVVNASELEWSEDCIAEETWDDKDVEENKGEEDDSTSPEDERREDETNWEEEGSTEEERWPDEREELTNDVEKNTVWEGEDSCCVDDDINALEEDDDGSKEEEENAALCVDDEVGASKNEGNVKLQLSDCICFAVWLTFRNSKNVEIDSRVGTRSIPMNETLLSP